MSTGGDIDVIFTADDREVGAGLDRLKMKAGGFAGEWAKASNKVKESFTGFRNIGPAVGMAFASGFALAGKAILDYAGKNDLARGSLDALQRAGQRTWTAIGRDISSVGSGPLVDIIDKLERVRQGAVDAVAGIFSSDAEGVGQAMRDTEAMIKSADEHKKIRAETLKIEADLLASNGDSVGAAKKRAMLEREANLERINQMGLTDGPDKARLIGLVNSKAKSDIQDAVNKKAADEKAKFDREWEANGRLDEQDRRARERADEDAKAREAAKERLNIEIRGAAIDAMRGTARAEEIARAEKELDLARKVMDIRGNGLLSEADKKGAISALSSLSEMEMAGGATRRGYQDWRTVPVSGNVGGATLAAVAGSGQRSPLMTLAQKQLSAGERTAKAVEKMAAEGLPARLG